MLLMDAVDRSLGEALDDCPRLQRDIIWFDGEQVGRVCTKASPSCSSVTEVDQEIGSYQPLFLLPKLLP